MDGYFTMNRDRFSSDEPLDKRVKIVTNDLNEPFHIWFSRARNDSKPFYPKSCYVSLDNAEWLAAAPGDFGSRGDLYQIYFRALTTLDDNTIHFFPYYFDR